MSVLSSKSSVSRSGSVNSLLQREWGDFSVVLEMKMNDLAVVWVNLPSTTARQDNERGFIKFGDKSVEFICEKKEAGEFPAYL